MEAPSQQPQNQQNRKNCPKHRCHLRSPELSSGISVLAPNSLALYTRRGIPAHNYFLWPDLRGEWRGGVSPPRSLRTGREPLGSSGSQYPAVGLVIQQLCLGHVAPPVTGWPPALGGIPQPLRSNSITEPSSLLRTAPSLCPASVLLPSRGSPA